MPTDPAPRYEGACHCGAIGFTFTTAIPPEQWSVRACRCSFCRRHGARTTSDPQGSVSFAVRDAARLSRYRFASRSADYLVCRECGVYIAALLHTAQGRYATLNLNTLRSPPSTLPEALPVSYDGESSDEKLARRLKRWTPVTGGL